IELPITRFGDVLPPAIPFTDDGAVAAMILAVAVILAGAMIGGGLARRVSILLAGGVAAYAIPYEVYAWAVAVLWVGLGGLALVMARQDRGGRTAFLFVDAVASQVGGAVSTAELRTQGQVAISVLWAFLGVVAFVAGLRLRIDDLRR